MFLCPPGRIGSSDGEPMNSFMFSVFPSCIAGLTKWLYLLAARSEVRFPLSGVQTGLWPGWLFCAVCVGSGITSITWHPLGRLYCCANSLGSLVGQRRGMQTSCAPSWPTWSPLDWATRASFDSCKIISYIYLGCLEYQILWWLVMQ